MRTFTDYQAYKLRAVAVIYIAGQPVTLDIVNATTTFALNTIPQGSFNVAVGRNTFTGLASAIHHIAGQLAVTLPVEVWLQVLPGANSVGFVFEPWPAEAFKIFSGLLTSTAYTKSREGTSLTANMIGWPADLNFSSALTRLAHTLTPQMMSGPAAFQGGGLGIEPSFTATTLASQFFAPTPVQLDMWGLSLGPWLRQLCQQDVLADPADLVAAARGNFEALAALNRFEPFVYADAANPSGRYRYGVPLNLPIAGLPGSETVASAIGEDVAAETFESMASTTMWDKLVGGFAAGYRFAVVPLVDTALVVPYTAGTRLPWQVIYGQEYSAIGSWDQKPRPIKGVRLFTGVGSMTGALGLQQGEAGQEAAMGGTYDNPDYPDGMLIYDNAPRWSANAVAAPAYGGQASAPFGVRGNAFFPGAGDPPVLADPAVVRGGVRTLWDLYARAVYITEALRGRSASVQGRLRFDIAPGSTVEVRVVQDKFVEAQVGVLGNVLYGEVQAVTTYIDSEARQASTTIQLANTRNILENTIDAMSIDQHPFYAAPWRGAPLVENDIFLPANQGAGIVFGP